MVVYTKMRDHRDFNRGIRDATGFTRRRYHLIILKALYTLSGPSPSRPIIDKACNADTFVRYRRSGQLVQYNHLTYHHRFSKEQWSFKSRLPCPVKATTAVVLIAMLCLMHHSGDVGLE